MEKNKIELNKDDKMEKNKLELNKDDKMEKNKLELIKDDTKTVYSDNEENFVKNIGCNVFNEITITIGNDIITQTPFFNKDTNEYETRTSYRFKGDDAWYEAWKSLTYNEKN